MSYPIELANDGHAKLTLEYDEENLGKDVFILVMSDGGGFSSVYVGKDELKSIVGKLMFELLSEKEKTKNY